VSYSSIERVRWVFALENRRKQIRQSSGREATRLGADFVHGPPTVSNDVTIRLDGSRVHRWPRPRHEEPFVLIMRLPVPFVTVVPRPHARPDRGRETGLLEKLTRRGILKALAGLQPTPWRNSPRIEAVLHSLKKKQFEVVAYHENARSRACAGRNSLHELHLLFVFSLAFSRLYGWANVVTAIEVTPGT